MDIKEHWVTLGNIGRHFSGDLSKEIKDTDDSNDLLKRLPVIMTEKIRG